MTEKRVDSHVGGEPVYNLHVGPPSNMNSAPVSGKKQTTPNRFLGRGCDEALFNEKKEFSVKRGEAIQ